MISCDIYDDLIKNHQSKESLENLVDGVLTHIQKYLFNDAKFVNQSQEKILNHSKQTSSSNISSTERILNLEKEIVVNNFPEMQYAIDDIRGFYYPPDGKIYLIKGSWCIETIIHEIMHACSIFTVYNPGLERYRFLMEGLTEFYAGYILYKQYYNTFKNCWRTKEIRNCKMTYPPSTKLWSTFCQFIPIKETYQMYFPVTNTESWSLAFKSFIDNINKQYGFAFNNPLEKKGLMPFHELFKAECSREIGKNFDQIYKSDKSMDFEKIKP